MTLTIETTTIGVHTISRQWDKHDGHQLFIGELWNGLLHTERLSTYHNEQAAIRAYKRAVKKLRHETAALKK